jgi:hypothetical protein
VDHASPIPQKLARAGESVQRYFLSTVSLQPAACNCYLGSLVFPLRDASVVVTCKLWMKVIKALARWRWRA